MDFPVELPRSYWRLQKVQNDADRVVSGSRPVTVRKKIG